MSVALDVHTNERDEETPVATESPVAPRHRFATALALAVGAVVFVGVGAVVGTLWGPQLVRTYLPSVAAEVAAFQGPQPVVEQLDDGYQGELVRRVAAVSAELGRSAYVVPTLEEATAGALQGLLTSSDAYALYLDPASYAAPADGESPDGEALVTGSLCEDVGLIAIERLTPGVAEAVARQVEALRNEGARAFVLDLRGNPGGSLNEAVGVASLFLDGGTVAEVIHADGTIDRIAADSAATLASEPLAVLVSSDTGSAAEALAAALQDHRRALLVGTVTAGRGGVQVVKTLSFGGAVAYAVSVFRTPDGYVVDGRGIAPDLVVPMDRSLQSEDPAADVQLAAALDVARAWLEQGSLELDGLSNEPGPQAAGVDQAHALERALIQAAADEESADDGQGSLDHEGFLDEADAAGVDEPDSPEAGNEEAADATASAVAHPNNDDIEA